MTRKAPQFDRAKASQTRKATGAFNAYVRLLARKPGTKNTEKIEQIDATLTAGTAQTKSGKTRVLSPAKRASLLVKRAALAGNVPTAPKHFAEIRQAALEVLPGLIDRNAWTRDILLTLGVPAVDLDEIGLA